MSKSPIQWLREKAKKQPTEIMEISAEEAANVGDCEPGTYHVDRWVFEGNVPSHMMTQLRRHTETLTNNETESESLRLGNGYRSGWNICRYYRTVYTKQ